MTPDVLAQHLRQQSDREFEKETLFQITQLCTASFGVHWQWIDERLCSGEWRVQDLIRACAIIKKLPDFNLKASSIRKAHLIIMVENPRDLEANAWSERADFMLEHLSTQKKATQALVSVNADAPSSPTNVNAPSSPFSAVVPSSPIVDDQTGNVTVTKSFLGLFNKQIGREEALREDPGTTVHQVAIPFPDGLRLYPEYLICPSTEQRATLEAPAMAFDIAGMIAQLPLTIPPALLQTIINNIKVTDLRSRPSTLPCFDRIRKVSKTKEGKAALTDVIQALAHAHWQVYRNASAYSFFHTYLRDLGIEVVINYDFDWSNTDGINVLDGEGQELRIYVGIPPAGRKVADRHRKRFEDTKEGEKHLSGKTFTFEGCGEDGKYLCTIHDVVFKGTQHQLDELVGQQPSSHNPEYHIGVNAPMDVASDNPGLASDEILDDEDGLFTS